MLSKNLTYLRKERKLNQQGVAAAIGISRSTLADYETGKSEPTASLLAKLSEFFDVTIDELVNGLIESPLFRQSGRKASLQTSTIRVLPITVNSQQRQYIEYVSVAAVAGYLSEYSQAQFIEQLPRFWLPWLTEGTYRAFDIQGDSMPPVHEGSVVIGRYIEHERDLKDNRRHVLVLRNDGVVFKKVIRESKKKDCLMLVSDNPVYAPYSIETIDVLEAWEMMAFIGFDQVYQDNIFLLNDRMQQIEQKLNQLITQP